MEDSGIIFKHLHELYGLELKPINSESDFLSELVTLSHIGIKRGEKTSEFHNKVTTLLEYVLRTENSELVLLLTETLINIQIHAKFFLTDNASNTKQLCDLILIQYKESKTEIYMNTMKLLNGCEGEFSKENIKAIVKPRIRRVDGNIFECFDLELTLELLHMYLIIDFDECKTLYKDIFVEWDQYDKQVTEVTFEKLLWYGFVLDEEEDLLKDSVLKYHTLLKSERFIKKYLLTKSTLNQEIIDKIDSVIKRFNKKRTYSIEEKKYISEKIDDKFMQKAQRDETKNLEEKLKDKSIKKEVKKLSPYNLPTGVRLGDINQSIRTQLAVYESQNMKEVINTISVEALTDKSRNGIYLNKTMIKKSRDLAKPGYVHVVHNKPMKKNEIKDNDNLFKWPSTDVTGTGFETDTGLNEKSALRKMGYQITNMSREKRWKILQRAVPTIGLKKVAYTIAGNLKLRKGQKNGRKKFRYAISEWEYDLSRLKKKYYKHNFKWPKT